MLPVQTKRFLDPRAATAAVQQQALANQIQAFQPKSVKPAKVAPNSFEAAYNRLKPQSTSLKLSPEVLARGKALKPVSTSKASSNSAASQDAANVVSQLSNSASKASSQAIPLSNQAVLKNFKDAGLAARNFLQIRLPQGTGTPDDSHFNSGTATSKQAQKSAA